MGCWHGKPGNLKRGTGKWLGRNLKFVRLDKLGVVKKVRGWVNWNSRSYSTGSTTWEVGKRFVKQRVIGTGGRSIGEGNEKVKSEMQRERKYQVPGQEDKGVLRRRGNGEVAMFGPAWSGGTGGGATGDRAGREKAYPRKKRKLPSKTSLRGSENVFIFDIPKITSPSKQVYCRRGPECG